MHQFLLTITATMPMKTIPIGGKDYLQRYFVSEYEDGSQDWLHHFLTADGDRHVHSHPWKATSRILSGGYSEIRQINGEQYQFNYIAGSINEIEPNTLHRIISVEPNTWTLMHVEAHRLDDWFFIDDEGNKEIMQASKPDWWREHQTRTGLAPRYLGNYWPVSDCVAMAKALQHAAENAAPSTSQIQAAFSIATKVLSHLNQEPDCHQCGESGADFDVNNLKFCSELCAYEFCHGENNEPEAA